MVVVVIDDCYVVGIEFVVVGVGWDCFFENDMVDDVFILDFVVDVGYCDGLWCVLILWCEM